MLKTKKHSNWIKCIIAFCIPVICIFIHMIVARCYPFGENTILIGDANSQYYVFARMLLNKIGDGSSMLFDWHAGMGYEFYQNLFYYLASPFNIIAMIIGRWDLELGVVLTMIFQVGMCSLTMMYYLCHTSRNTRENKNLNTWICLLIAVAYSMCDYMVAYQYTYIWLISLILAPVVMLGVERIFSGESGKLYIISMILVFITNFYFAWFVCLLSAIWAVDCLDTKNKGWWLYGLYYVLHSILAATISAFVLLPCYLTVLGRKYMMMSGYTDPLTTFGNVANFLQGFLWGSSIDTLGSSIYTNNNYTGIVILGCMMLFAVDRNVKLKKRVKRIIGIAAMIIASNWLAGIYIFHGFTYPNMFCNRQAFIISILILISAFEFLVDIPELRIKDVIIVISVYAIMIAYALFGNTEMESAVVYLVTICIVLYFLVCAWLYVTRRIKKNALIVNFIVIGFIELISNYYFVSGDSYDVSMDRKADTKEWQEIYNDIKFEKGERKTSWVVSQNNMAYSDTNIFSSVMSRDVWNLYRSLGLVYQGNGGSFAYRGTTPVTSMLFNVRNVLTDNVMYYGGYNAVEKIQVHNSYMENDIELQLCENQYLSGLGFMVDDSIRNWNVESDNPFEVQNYFTSNVMDVCDAFEDAGITEWDVAGDGCEITAKDKKTLSYTNVLQSDDYYSRIAYCYTVPDDMDMYVHIKDKHQTITSVYVDGNAVLDDSTYKSPAEMIHIGNVKKGQRIILLMDNNTSPGESSMTNIYVYKYNDAVMQQVLAKVEDYYYDVTKFDGTTVQGNINASEDGIMYTSIPYYKGWKAYVDGEQADIIKIGNALCGVKLSSGLHTVEFKYFPYGLKLGLIISMIGIFVAGGIEFYNKRKGLGVREG